METIQVKRFLIKRSTLNLTKDKTIIVQSQYSITKGIIQSNNTYFDTEDNKLGTNKVSLDLSNLSQIQIEKQEEKTLQELQEAQEVCTDYDIYNLGSHKLYVRDFDKENVVGEIYFTGEAEGIFLIPYLTSLGLEGEEVTYKQAYISFLIPTDNIKEEILRMLQEINPVFKEQFLLVDAEYIKDPIKITHWKELQKLVYKYLINYYFIVKETSDDTLMQTSQRDIQKGRMFEIPDYLIEQFRELQNKDFKQEEPQTSKEERKKAMVDNFKEVPTEQEVQEVQEEQQEKNQQTITRYFLLKKLPERYLPKVSNSLVKHKFVQVSSNTAISFNLIDFGKFFIFNIGLLDTESLDYKCISKSSFTSSKYVKLFNEDIIKIPTIIYKFGEYDLICEEYFAGTDKCFIKAYIEFESFKEAQTFNASTIPGFIKDITFDQEYNLYNIWKNAIKKQERHFPTKFKADDVVCDYGIKEEGKEDFIWDIGVFNSYTIANAVAALLNIDSSKLSLNENITVKELAQWQIQEVKRNEK